jgi:3',5'-cyclic AMP phosphodiesterase CpdA
MLYYICFSRRGVSEETQAALIADQLLHIEAALANATSSANPPTWLFVVGHYPVFSPGSHGDTDELLLYLQPLLEQYRVDAYICGHDHLSAHLT